MNVSKVCAHPGCYALISRGIDRCVEHRLPKRGYQHRLASAHVMANATHCWICGKRPTRDDPLTADHVVPVALGGLSVPGNYRAAHRSCNSRRGARVDL